MNILIVLINLYTENVHAVIHAVCVALTSPTGGGRSVGIVRLRTKATEFSLVLCDHLFHFNITGIEAMQFVWDTLDLMYW
jgi:hypothetical protein